MIVRSPTRSRGRWAKLAGAVGLLLLASTPAASPGVAAATETPTWDRPGLGGAVRPEMGPPQPGDPAPALTLPRLDGKPFDLASTRGAWVLLHFTASWCPYCDAEVEHLGKIARAYAKKNVRVVLVDVQEEKDHWLDYAKANVDPAIVALSDETGDRARLFAPPRAQPSFEDRAQAIFDSTLILDPRGTIRLFLLPDSKHFDPTFAAVRRELDSMIAKETKP